MKQKYVIVMKQTLYDLETEVNKSIMDGYMPIGNLVAIQDNHSDTNFTIVQPMLYKDVQS